MQKGAPPHSLWDEARRALATEAGTQRGLRHPESGCRGPAASLLPGAPPQLHSSQARPLGLRVVGIFVHFFFIRRVTVVVKREALVAEGRQQRPGGIAVAQRRGGRAHRLRPLPAGVRRERGDRARGRPRPGAAVSREPGVGRGPSSPPPPRRPHRARHVQTGGAAAGTCSPSRPRARRAWPIRAGTGPRCLGDAWTPRRLCSGLRAWRPPPGLGSAGPSSSGQPAR